MPRRYLWGSPQERSRLPLSWWEMLLGDIGHGYVTLGVEACDQNRKTDIQVIAKVRWPRSESAEWVGDYKDILAIDPPTVAQAVFDRRPEFFHQAWPEGPRHDSVVRIFDLRKPKDWRPKQWYICANEFLAKAQRQQVLLRWVTKNNPDLTLGAELELGTARTIVCPYKPLDLESFGITVPVGLLNGGLSVKTWDGQRCHDTNELWLQTPRRHPKFHYEQQTILVRLQPNIQWVEFLFWPNGRHIYYKAEFPTPR